MDFNDHILVLLCHVISIKKLYFTHCQSDTKVTDTQTQLE